MAQCSLTATQLFSPEHPIARLILVYYSGSCLPNSPTFRISQEPAVEGLTPMVPPHPPCFIPFHPQVYTVVGRNLGHATALEVKGSHGIARICLSLLEPSRTCWDLRAGI